MFPPQVENRLLGLLCEEVYRPLLQASEYVRLAQGETIYGAGDHLGYVYFPTTCVISMICIMENGASSEMGLVGNDGAVGICQLMGSDMATCNSAVVQVAGDAIRLKARIFQREFQQGGSFQHVHLHYVQTLINQISQIAVCNSLHPIEQRLSRRLLMIWDRLHFNAFATTQEFVAHMLGVRRATVTDATHQLQAAGLIRCIRGHITMLDRRGLEEAACECYRVVKYDHSCPLQTVA